MKDLLGYVCIGHILEAGSQQEIKEIVWDFCSILINESSMPEEAVNQGPGIQQQFTEFFSNLDLTLETIGTFMSVVLKQSDFDEESFQNKVERIAFENVKFQLTNSMYLLPPKTCFQLFCLFNRFCRTDSLPLRIPTKSMDFLAKRLYVIPPLDDFDGSLKAMFKHVAHYSETRTIRAIMKCYNEFVRGVLIEARLKHRIFGQKATYKDRIKTVSLTSDHIVVYDDDETDPNQTEVPTTRTPTGPVIFKMALIKFKMETIKKEGMVGFSLRGYPRGEGIDLWFNESTQAHDKYKWSSSIKTAIGNNKKRMSQLTNIKTGHHLEDQPLGAIPRPFRSVSTTSGATTTSSGDESIRSSSVSSFYYDGPSSQDEDRAENKPFLEEKKSEEEASIQHGFKLTKDLDLNAVRNILRATESYEEDKQNQQSDRTPLCSEGVIDFRPKNFARREFDDVQSLNSFTDNNLNVDEIPSKPQLRRQTYNHTVVSNLD